MLSPRLTVLQMLPALESGGVERGTLEVAGALAAAGHRSLVMSRGGRLVEQLEAAGSEHLPWPIGEKSPITLRLVRRLRHLLAERTVDVLHVRSRMPGWVGWLAWRKMDPRTRPRLITTVHGLYSPGPYSAIMTRGEVVVAVSETVRAYLLEHYPRLDPDRIRVIHRGVAAECFPHGHQPSADWLARWGAEHPQLDGKFVLVFPGRLTRLKGHFDFLAIVERLVARGVPVHGLVVGGDGRRGYAASLAREVGSRRLPVTFLGHRSDLREVMAVSDVVLSLSRRPESFGRTVLEALSLGVPTLGYAHGGVGEILAKAWPRGAIPLGDVDAAAAWLAAQHAQPERPPPCHAFPLSRMLDATLGLYEALAGERAV